MVINVKKGFMSNIYKYSQIDDILRKSVGVDKFLLRLKKLVCILDNNFIYIIKPLVIHLFNYLFYHTLNQYRLYDPSVEMQFRNKLPIR